MQACEVDPDDIWMSSDAHASYVKEIPARFTEFDVYSDNPEALWLVRRHQSPCRLCPMLCNAFTFTHSRTK
jgi:hypothetical protein